MPDPLPKLLVSFCDGFLLPEDHAERTAACVNAMAGVKDPQAFMEAMKKMDGFYRHNTDMSMFDCLVDTTSMTPEDKP